MSFGRALWLRHSFLVQVHASGAKTFKSNPVTEQSIEGQVKSLIRL